MGRAPCCDKANVKRGPWSPEEDATLKDYVEKNGTGGNWIALPQKAGLRRCGKSCRLRWLNYLRPDIKHGGFTEMEDSIICTLYRKLGSRWSIIASQLPGRTDNDVKNYWNTKLKKKVLSPEATGAVAATPKKPKSHIQQLPSRTPRLPSPPAATRHMTAVEPPDIDYSIPSSTIPARDSGGIELICQGPMSVPVAPNFPEPNGYVVSPPHDISAASSSSLTMDGGGEGGGGHVPWLDGGIEALLDDGDDYAFFTDMGPFGCAASDFLTWCGPFDRIGEPPQVPPGHSPSNMSHISNPWANGAHGGSAQKLYQSVTNM